jgi:hypothetical protein
VELLFAEMKPPEVTTCALIPIIACCLEHTELTHYRITGEIISTANTVTLLAQPAAISQIGSQLKFDFGTLQPG